MKKVRVTDKLNAIDDILSSIDSVLIEQRNEKTKRAVDRSIKNCCPQIFCGSIPIEYIDETGEITDSYTLDNFKTFIHENDDSDSEDNEHSYHCECRFCHPATYNRYHAYEMISKVEPTISTGQVDYYQGFNITKIKYMSVYDVDYTKNNKEILENGVDGIKVIEMYPSSYTNMLNNMREAEREGDLR